MWLVLVFTISDLDRYLIIDFCAGQRFQFISFVELDCNDNKIL